MKKTMSPKQLAANRRNARRSTGPRTAAGKGIARLNALKHGILSREVIVRGWKIQESASAFTALQTHFWSHFDPVGPLEMMLVDRIVTTYWRLRRAVTAESGEIALSVDSGHWHGTRPGRVVDQLLLASLSPMHDAALTMTESAWGLDYLVDTLTNIRAAVERDGELTEAAMQLSHHGGKPTYLTHRLASLRAAAIVNVDGLNKAAVKAGRRRHLLSAINRMIEEYHREKHIAAEREAAQASTRQAAAVLPPAAQLDKILRYETALERQLYRAIFQLEREQRRRQGEFVPLPLSSIMEVSPR